MVSCATRRNGNFFGIKKKTPDESLEEKLQPAAEPDNQAESHQSKEGPPVEVNLPKSSRPKSTIKIPNINSLMTSDKKPESKSNGSSTHEEPKHIDEVFTDDQLREVWMEFAALRKMYHAEYQLLTQEYEIVNHQILVHLHNPVQETILDTLRSDMTTFLRDKLRNNTIQVVGALKESTDKKVVYTNREKFEHLAEKNPALFKLKERLGLDPDF